jgi:5-dehydro-2-deoxygluconokinase
VDDPYCRGILVLGLEAPATELQAAFRAAATSPLVKGFAVGRTIFADAAAKWLPGKMTDQAAVADMAAKFQTLVSEWTTNVETARKTAR